MIKPQNYRYFLLFFLLVQRVFLTKITERKTCLLKQISTNLILLLTNLHFAHIEKNFIIPSSTIFLYVTFIYIFQSVPWAPTFSQFKFLLLSSSALSSLEHTQTPFVFNIIGLYFPYLWFLDLYCFLTEPQKPSLPPSNFSSLPTFLSIWTYCCGKLYHSLHQSSKAQTVLFAQETFLCMIFTLYVNLEIR